MNKRLSLLITIVFLTTQVLAFLHLSENGFEKHEHNNTACLVCLNFENSKYIIYNVPTSISSLVYLCFTIRNLPELLLTYSYAYDPYIPRAPPSFS